MSQTCKCCGVNIAAFYKFRLKLYKNLHKCNYNAAETSLIRFVFQMVNNCTYLRCSYSSCINIYSFLLYLKVVGLCPLLLLIIEAWSWKWVRNRGPQAAWQFRRHLEILRAKRLTALTHIHSEDPEILRATIQCSAARDLRTSSYGSLVKGCWPG